MTNHVAYNKFTNEMYLELGTIPWSEAPTTGAQWAHELLDEAKTKEEHHRAVEIIRNSAWPCYQCPEWLQAILVPTPHN